jgi:glycosyltransferase involved in cell wall biosynthesis
MSPDRLKILCVSQMPASPPRFGAQARIHGLLTELSKRHDISAIMLVDEVFDADECRRAMQVYCRDVLLVPNPMGREGTYKRLLQLRSLASTLSFQRFSATVPALQEAVDKVLRSQHFDIINLEFPFLDPAGLRKRAPGKRTPAVVIDSHNIEFDLARQLARNASSLERRVYYEINWRKLLREELDAYRYADAVYLCSADDERRLLELAPAVRTAVVPNAADTEYYHPRPTDLPPDGLTVMFFGLLSYLPNVDGVIHFVQDIWPHIANAHPQVRLKIVGGQAPPVLQALAGPKIEFTGFVPDLRPHLASAAAVVTPLRLGGGTRLKIVEAMAMGKAIISTSLGAEGIDAVDGRDMLIADGPVAFAEAVNRTIADPTLAARLGASARRLSAERYSWAGAARQLEAFYRQILDASV